MDAFLFRPLFFDVLYSSIVMVMFVLLVAVTVTLVMIRIKPSKP